MRSSLIGILFLAAVFFFGTSTTMASTMELTLSSGADTVSCISTSSCSASFTKTSNSIKFVGLVNGWIVNFDEGTSNSPSALPFGIQLQTASATCQSSACWNSPLTVDFGGVSFTTVASDFDSTYANNGQLGETGSPMQKGWVNTGNALLGEVTLIGALTGPGTVTGGGSAGPSPYSLTIQDKFGTTGGTFSPVDFASFNGAGILGATPEPATMLLFGSGLLLFGIVLRKRLHA